MARLEDLTTGTLVKGILPDALTELLSAKFHGSLATCRSWAKDYVRDPERFRRAIQEALDD